MAGRDGWMASVARALLHTVQYSTMSSLPPSASLFADPRTHAHEYLLLCDLTLTLPHHPLPSRPPRQAGYRLIEYVVPHHRPCLNSNVLGLCHQSDRLVDHTHPPASS